jgi:hypothetical protein
MCKDKTNMNRWEKELVDLHTLMDQLDIHLEKVVNNARTWSEKDPESQMNIRISRLKLAQRSMQTCLDDIQALKYFFN